MNQLLPIYPGPELFNRTGAEYHLFYFLFSPSQQIIGDQDAFFG
mgnify:CR=1 FL=1